MEQRKKKSGNSNSRKKSSRRKQSVGSNVPAKPSTSSSNLLSLSNIGNLRDLCKNCIKYMQQADVWLDTLYVASNSLNESGLLKKVISTKGKGLSTGDLAGLLMAFINTPLADQFFKGGPSSNSKTESTSAESAKETTPTQTLSSQQQPTPPGPGSNFPSYPGASPHFQQPVQPPAWPGYMQNYGSPPPGYPMQYPPQFPPYRHPPQSYPQKQSEQ